MQAYTRSAYLCAFAHSITQACHLTVQAAELARQANIIIITPLGFNRATLESLDSLASIAGRW